MRVVTLWVSTQVVPRRECECVNPQHWRAGNLQHLALIVYGDGTTRVSNPVCYPRFRASASVTDQRVACHWCSSISTHFTNMEFQFPSAPQVLVSNDLPWLSRGFHIRLRGTACARFTPTNLDNACHLRITAGCWHGLAVAFWLDTAKAQLLSTCSFSRTVYWSETSSRRHQTCNYREHPHRRPSFGLCSKPNVADHPSGRLYHGLGEPLPPIQLMHRGSIHQQKPGLFPLQTMRFEDLCGFRSVSECYPPLMAGYPRVTHLFATRLTSASTVALVRLVCIRHAASVRVLSQDQTSWKFEFSWALKAHF